MKMTHKGKMLLVLTTVICALASVCLSQQPQPDMLSKPVSQFELQDVLPSLVLERIAKSRHVPIGFEAILQESKKIDVKVEQGTIRDVLDAVVQSDPRYQWSEADGIINVSPKQNKSPILETVVRSFSVHKLNRVDAVTALFALPEVKGIVTQMGLSKSDFGSLPGPAYDNLPRLSLSFRNITVRKIMNEILKAEGSDYWVFFRYGDHNQYFSLQ
jgi:hypothetical protein